MNNERRTIKRFLQGLALVAILLPAFGCGPGTVYVGVAAPGPWVGYPPGGVYGRYPGVYGRPWYSPEEEPKTEESAAKDERTDTAEESGESGEG